MARNIEIKAHFPDLAAVRRKAEAIASARSDTAGLKESELMQALGVSISALVRDAYIDLLERARV
jgi:hypothetical protein